MTKREIEIKVRLNQKEAEHLNRQVEKYRLSREAYLRHLIAGVVPREAPPPEYFAFMRGAALCGQPSQPNRTEGPCAERHRCQAVR